MRKEWMDYIFIALGSILYALATILFIFPDSLLLGGTSGISVILNAYLPFSSETILVCINCFLLLLALIVLGKDMAFKTFIGSTLTTFFFSLLENICRPDAPLLPWPLLSAVIGASVIAIASGIMFCVDSSSGGTDIVALIVKKYFRIQIGKALLITDILIVAIGGILSGYQIALCSFTGLLIKTFGIDWVISFIKKQTSRE